MIADLILYDNFIYFFPVLGTASIITLMIGIYSLSVEWSMKKTAKYIFKSIKDESEKLAQNNKAVLKAEGMGVRLTASDYVTIVCISIIFGILVSIIFKSIFLVIIGLLIGYMLPERLIDIAKANKQKAYLETAIPGTEMIAINNMHTPNMVKAIIMSLDNMQDPFKSEMQQVVFEVNSGKSTLSDALDNMVTRTKSRYLKKVAASIKFADSIGGNGWKMLQADANLLNKDKEIYEKAEKRLKSSRFNSFVSSLLQLAPIFIVRISLPETYDFVMSTLFGQALIFLVLIKIIFDFYLINKKTMSVM